MASAPFQLWIDLPSVASASRTSNVVTVTTDSAHGLASGTWVQLEGFSGSSGTTMNGVWQATRTSDTQFTIASSGTNGSGTVSSAVVSRDLFSPLPDVSTTDRSFAVYAITEGVQMSAAGDGNTDTMGFRVYQDDTPSAGPWFSSLPDQARVRLCKVATGTTPTDGDLYFIGTVSGFSAQTNGAGLGTVTDVSVDEINAILDKLLVVGTSTSTNPTATESGFVRSGGVTTVTTANEHGFPLGQQFTVSGVNKGATVTFNGTFTVDTVPSTKEFTYTQTGAPGSTGNEPQSTISAVLDDSRQKVTITTNGNHNLPKGSSVVLSGFVGSTNKFTNQLNGTFSGTNYQYVAVNKFIVTLSSPLEKITPKQTVTTLGTSIGVAKITAVGKINSKLDFTITGGQSEDAAAQAALARVNSAKSSDAYVQRLLKTNVNTNVTGAGSSSANSIGVTMPAASLRSVLDGIVETFGGEDKKQRRYYIGLDRTLYYKLTDSSSQPTYATAPYKIISTGTQNPDTSTDAATVFANSISVQYDHNTVKSALFNISSSVDNAQPQSKVQSYRDAGYSLRKGAPVFDSTVNYPTAAANPDTAIPRAAKAYFLEAHTPLLTITFTLRGAGTAAWNNLGFSAGYYRSGSSYLLQKRWEPGQWVEITCAELGLSGLYRVEQVNWTLGVGSFLQEITITANRRDPNNLVNQVKSRSK